MLVIKMSHLLIQVAFATANIADALQQFPEISATIAFQSIIVQREALLNELMEVSRCPLSEACGHLRLHAITHSDNHIKVVVANLTVHTSIALLAN